MQILKLIGGMDMNKNLFIAGQTGSGKSYHVKTVILPDIIANDPRFRLIVDYKNEYDGDFVCVSKMTSPAKYDQVYRYAVRHKKNQAVIKMDRYDPEYFDVLFSYLNQCRDKILIFDEASFYFEDLKRGKIPFDTKRFFRSATLQHNQSHNVILITQSPQDIPKMILGQFQDGLIFYLKPFQLEYLYKAAFIPRADYDFSEKYKFYKV